MSGFIPYGTTVPTLTRSEFQWNGLTFGGSGARPLQQKGITGIELAAMASSDAQRPLDGGEFIGIDVMKGRDITVDFLDPYQTTRPFIPTSIVTDLSAYSISRKAFAGAMYANGVREAPLFVADENAVVFAVMARPRKFAAPKDYQDWQLATGFYTTLFHATDPRLYAAPTKRLTISDSGSGTTGVATNGGTVEMRPVLTITPTAGVPPGPDPITVQNTTLGVNWQFQGLIAIGDYIVVDMDFHTVTYFPASGAPYSVVQQVNPNSTWWNLPPGANTIELLAGTIDPGTARLDLDYADAYAGI